LSRGSDPPPMRRVDEGDPDADRVEANWLQLKGYLREKWGELTDDDLDRAKGRKEQLVGYLEERTARERAELERDLEALSERAQYFW